MTIEAITLAARHGFHVVFPVDLVDPDDKRVLDWAEPYLAQVNRWDIGWLLGRYVHADRANRNGHIFPLDDLKDSYKLVNHTPLNMQHRPRDIIGTFIASELLWPLDGAATDAGDPPTPWVETLAAVWRHVYPQTYADIKAATAKGIAALSMEAYPETIGCGTCDAVYPFDGVTSDTYTCGHLKDRRAPKRLFKPHFVGGGVILPPAQPGWRDAQIKQVAALFEQDPIAAAALEADIESAFAGIDVAEAELLMGGIIADAGLVDEVPVRTATRLPEPTDAQVTAAICPKCSAEMTSPECSCGYVSAAADVADEDLDAMVAEALDQLGLSAAETPRRGAMVALYPPPEVAEALVDFGSEPVDELHVTIVYLGTVDELDYTADDVVAALAGLSADSIQATVSGLGRFALEDGNEATYASVDAPGLNSLHEQVRSALTAAGLSHHTNHGFTPHITLAYHAPGEGPTAMPPTKSWTATDLHVVWAGDHHSVLFAGQ